MPEAPFEIPVFINLAALFLFAATGALAAIQRGYDLVGLLALALVTATGGALIRDGVFIQQGPPAIATDWRFITAVLAGAAACLFLRRAGRGRRFERVIAHADALGLGAYAVVGAQMSLAAGLSAPAAVLVGVINAAGGGLMRDVLTREEPLVFRPGQFYVLAALAGATVFVVLVVESWMAPTAAAWTAIVLTYLLRALAIRFNWRTEPLVRPET
jgi:uncharacterized membrane protein YeiH